MSSLLPPTAPLLCVSNICRFDSHVYNSQLMQAEAVGLAYRAWRREWRGKGKQYVRLSH